MKFRYYRAYFKPIDIINIGGTQHYVTIKAIDYEHALKHANKLANWKNESGKTVYKLVMLKEIA